MSAPTLRIQLHNAVTVPESAERDLAIAQAARDAARDRVNELINQIAPLEGGAE